MASNAQSADAPILLGDKAKDEDELGGCTRTYRRKRAGVEEVAGQGVGGAPQRACSRSRACVCACVRACVHARVCACARACKPTPPPILPTTCAAEFSPFFGIDKGAVLQVRVGWACLHGPQQLRAAPHCWVREEGVFACPFAHAPSRASPDRTAPAQEARCFNDSQIDPRKCQQVITKLLYLLAQGESFTKVRARPACRARMHACTHACLVAPLSSSKGGRRSCTCLRASGRVQAPGLARPDALVHAPARHCTHPRHCRARLEG